MTPEHRRKISEALKCHHSAANDARKDEAARNIGWKLIRIPEHDVTTGTFREAMDVI